MRIIISINFLLISLISAAAPEDDFVITVQTDISDTTDPLIFIITKTGSGFNYNVDCNNDGIDEATAQQDEYVCDYSDLGGAGTYTIRVKDNSGSGTGFPRFTAQRNFNNAKKITSLDQWGTGQWTRMAVAFGFARNMVVKATDIPNLEAVTDFQGMFASAELADPDVSSWDVSSALNMRSMFSNASSANPDVSNWNVSSVTDMESMFSFTASADPDVSEWDVSKVTDMRAMFLQAGAANPDVSKWDVSMVTDMEGMFSSAISANPDVSQWDVLSVTNMRAMFSNARMANPDVSQWDVSLVTNMELMFSNAVSANPDVSQWDVSLVTDMSGMFNGAVVAETDVSGWVTTLLSDADGMFSGAVNAQPDASGWQVTSLSTAENMLTGVSMPMSTYDNLLINWAAQAVNQDVVLGAGNSFYCDGDAARMSLVENFNWHIIDNGLNCDTDLIFINGFE